MAAAAAAAISCGMAPGAALGGISENASSAMAYLRADLEFSKGLGNAEPAAVASAERFVVQTVAECPGALTAAPRTGGFSEMRREAGVAVLFAFARPFDVPALAFARRVSRLRWTSRRLTSRVRLLAVDDREEARLLPPDLCADLRTWTAGGYRSVPAETKRVLASQESEGTHVGDEEILRLLRPLENARMSALARSINGSHAQIAHSVDSALPAILKRMATGLGIEGAAASSSLRSHARPPLG